MDFTIINLTSPFFNFRVRSYLISVEYSATKNENSDQTLRSVASDLGLECLCHIEERTLGVSGLAACFTEL